MAPGLIERVDVMSDLTGANVFEENVQGTNVIHASDQASGRLGNGAASTHRNGCSEAETRPIITPRLTSFSQTDIHDLVCVGFGPASLAIAVALQDMQETQSTGATGVSDPKVRFLEKQGAFFWHAGMLLPGAKMQISFIKDLATLRNPRSHFTFLNYLYHHNRLVQFTNLGTFLPSRVEFEDYLRWAAGHFSHVVSYGQTVEQIRPIRSNDGKCTSFEVQTRDSATGETSTILGKNVVIAVGGKPSIPPAFPRHHAQILHSSEYSTRITQVLPSKDKSYSIAVVGSGQSAAEVFNDLHSRYPNASTRLIIRDTALRPSDDSPFVNEVFNPEAVDAFYHQPDAMRVRNLAKDKVTNYSVVRLGLLEDIYDAQYRQSIHQPDKTQWRHQILPSREVIDVQDHVKQLRVTTHKLCDLGSSTTEVHHFDAVILATGYTRNAHEGMLQDCQSINASPDGSWHTARNYSVLLDRSRVEKDVGIWLQGCNEATHGLADSLLSILATRSGELVNSLFGQV